MLKIARFIEGLLLPAISITCLLISLGDLFDVLHFLADRLPMLTLLVVSLIMTSTYIIQNRCDEINKKVQRLLVKAELENLGRVVEQVEPHLRKVLDDDYFLDTLKFLQGAVKESIVHVNDWVRFRHYYVRTFQLTPRTTFLSVSTALLGHWWKDATIGNTMAQFIKRGGKIKQVFILKDAKELALPEAKAMVANLQSIGVQVSIVYTMSIPNELRKNFIVEAKGKIGWEMHLDGEGNVTTSIVTTNQQKTADYRKIFEKLRGSAPHKIL